MNYKRICSVLMNTCRKIILLVNYTFWHLTENQGSTFIPSYLASFYINNVTNLKRPS